MCQHQNRMWNEVLVKWKHCRIDETTWENEAKFKANFLDFCHWGQWPFLGGGVMLSTKGRQCGRWMEMKNYRWKFEARGGINEFT